MKSNVKTDSIIWGLLIIVAGMLLLAFNMGMLPLEYKSAVFSWPMLPIVVGFVCLFSRQKWFGGVILMLIGGFFLLPRLNTGNFDFIVQNRWAMVLMAGGVLVLCKTIWGKRFSCCNKENLHVKTEWHSAHHADRRKNHQAGPGYINRDCVFGGNKERVDTQEFRGGDLNCVFGGIELDFMDAQLAEGVHRLEVNSVFGGCVLYIPATWKVEVQSTQVFGQFVDKRPKPEFGVDEKRILVIEANAIFGGGEIKCK